MSEQNLGDILVDARVDPDAAQHELDKAFKEPPLTLDIPSSDTVDLPAGYIGEDNILHRQAQIRELNGRDEEYLARQILKTAIPIPVFTDVVLSRNVTSLGSVQSPPKEMLRKLLRGDRYALALAIRQLTYGDDWELLEVPCPRCDEKFDVVVELNKDVKTRKLDNPRERTIDVDLRHGHKATVRFINGQDELEAVGNELNRTVAEMTTTYINRCLLAYDGKPPLQPMAEDMGVMDRQKIIEAIQEHAPGPIMEEVSVPCSQCGHEFFYPLNLADLFRV